MKKKIIVSNLLILFISLITLLIGMNFLLDKVLKNSAEKEIKNYLNIAENIYDGNNIEQTAKILVDKNTEIRITFIDSKTYEVVYDYGYNVNLEENYENHKNRPEILNLGKVFIRKSTTLNIDMIYIATVDSGMYIRLSIPISNINSLKVNYYLYAFLIWIIIASISSITIIISDKYALKSINLELKKIINIVDNSQIKDVDIDELPNKVEKTRLLLESKINEITAEKEKLNYVINNISQGFIILDGNSNVYLINNIALNIFDNAIENIINKNIIYLTHEKEILDNIKKCLENKSSFSFEHLIKNKNYILTFNYLGNNWQFENSNCGVSIMIMDISMISQVELMKKDFFANASHELKSPLTTLIGNLQLITQGIVVDKEELKKLMEACEKEAKRMAKIITDMLELSYLESREFNDIKTLNLKDIAIETLEKYNLQIKNKHLVIETDIKSSIKDMNVSDVQYLFSNLIDNAIKYTQDKGKIIIKLNANYLVVQDNGIGISKEHQKRIFERFYRVDKSKSKELGGTGLGLSIVKHICNKYNFEIILESKLNKGTKFTIKF